MEDFSTIADKLGSIECNGKPCYGPTPLMDIFKCPSMDQFEREYVESVRIRLNQLGEVPENHIILTKTVDGSTLICLLSSLATREIARIALNNQIADAAIIMDLLECECLNDSSFFVNPQDPKRPLQVGEKVEIIENRPAVLHPNTAMIPYKGRKGRIVGKSEQGNFYVVCHSMAPAAEFSPKQLKRVIK